MEVVTRTQAADHLTPVRAYAALRAQSPGRSSFLFESVVPGERWGRYSIIGYRARTEAIASPGDEDALALFGAHAEGLVRTDSLAARVSQAVVGYLAYDAVHAPNRIESWPREPDLARVMRDCTVVVFDNLRQTMTLAGRTDNALDRCAWEMTHGPELRPFPVPDANATPLHLSVSMDDASYGARVERAKEYIRAGDAFQIVLARTFTAPARNADAFDVYRALRVLSPSPYLYFLDFAEVPMSEAMCVAGASPETMVRVEHGQMVLRPIAGTRPRGATEAEDAALTAALLADPKERAEHVMLIDLARNDLGRVCKPGSIQLSLNMGVERYSHVMHIVSEVVGEHRAEAAMIDLVRACFPAGTLSGAPKVRAMQIIRELEGGPRGIYGGAIGWMHRDELDLAIAIRTVVARGGQLEVTAGAGIVHDSVPELEAAETRNKARAALAAIRAAQDAAA
ncbi:MAG: anthranilate synthase component I family protein [Polyangiaceae bacterium]